MKERSDNTLVATIPKDQREELRIELARYKGNMFAAMRIWARPGLGEKHRPTEKGLTVPMRMLFKLVDALRATQAEAEADESQSEFQFPTELYKQN